MHYAVMSFQTDFTVRPDELAREVEARGFESLWFPDLGRAEAGAEAAPADSPLPAAEARRDAREARRAGSIRPILRRAALG